MFTSGLDTFGGGHLFGGEGGAGRRRADESRKGQCEAPASVTHANVGLPPRCRLYLDKVTWILLSG